MLLDPHLDELSPLTHHRFGLSSLGHSSETHVLLLADRVARSAALRESIGHTADVHNEHSTQQEIDRRRMQHLLDELADEAGPIGEEAQTWAKNKMNQAARNRTIARCK